MSVGRAYSLRYGEYSCWSTTGSHRHSKEYSWMAKHYPFYNILRKRSYSRNQCIEYSCIEFLPFIHILLGPRVPPSRTFLVRACGVWRPMGLSVELMCYWDGENRVKTEKNGLFGGEKGEEWRWMWCLSLCPPGGSFLSMSAFCTTTQFLFVYFSVAIIVIGIVDNLLKSEIRPSLMALWLFHWMLLLVDFNCISVDADLFL